MWLPNAPGRRVAWTDLVDGCAFEARAAAEAEWVEKVKVGSCSAPRSMDGKALFFTRHSAQGNQILWVPASATDKLRAAVDG